jgi:hypothetical protein
MRFSRAEVSEVARGDPEIFGSVREVEGYVRKMQITGDFW